MLILETFPVFFFEGEFRPPAALTTVTAHVHVFELSGYFLFGGRRACELTAVIVWVLITADGRAVQCLHAADHRGSHRSRLVVFAGTDTSPLAGRSMAPFMCVVYLLGFPFLVVVCLLTGCVSIFRVSCISHVCLGCLVSAMCDVEEGKERIKGVKG